jgi:hypothetical protein
MTLAGLPRIAGDAPSLSRRSVLAALGSASVAATAGCLAGDEPVTPRLGGPTVLNHDPKAYTVDVVVLDGGEPIYWAAERATAATGTTAGGAVFEGYPTDPSQYVLHARLEGQPRDEWVDIDFAAFDAACLTVSLQIGEFGNSDERGDLSLWRSANPRGCDGSTPTSGGAA